MLKILVPTDFSECANHAAKNAIQLAKTLNAEVDFLHFNNTPIDWISLNNQDGTKISSIEEKITNCENKLNDLAKSANNQGVVSKSFIGYNQNYYDLIEHADKHKIDLMVMGSNGACGFRDFLNGSNAQHIINLSKIPLFIISKEFKTENVERIVITSEFDNSDNSIKHYTKEFNKIASISNRLELKLDFLYLNTPDIFYSKNMVSSKMKDYRKLVNYSIDRSLTLDADNLTEGVNSFMQENKNAIIAMLSKGYLGIGKGKKINKTDLSTNYIKPPMFSLGNRP